MSDFDIEVVDGKYYCKTFDYYYEKNEIGDPVHFEFDIMIRQNTIEYDPRFHQKTDKQQ